MYYAQIALINSHLAMTLTWDATTAPDFSYYEIYASKNDNQNYVSIGVSSETTFITPPLEQNKTYYFTIYAWDINENRSKLKEELMLHIPVI